MKLARLCWLLLWLAMIFSVALFVAERKTVLQNNALIKYDFSGKGG